MAKEDKKYSKYYYEYDRNMSTTVDSLNDLCNVCNHENQHGTIGKCVCQEDGGDGYYTTDEKGVRLLVDKRIPEYYKGKEGYEARKVCDNFELPYHLATAVTYLLRAYHKHESPVEDITKAIAHLEFELEKIKRENNER